MNPQNPTGHEPQPDPALTAATTPTVVPDVDGDVAADEVAVERALRAGLADFELDETDLALLQDGGDTAYGDDLELSLIHI